jgi:hypothetical protein
MLDKLTPDPENLGIFKVTERHTIELINMHCRSFHGLIVMHNIDVMHQECNMGESIISTCMGFLGITKDNMKAR